jgi:hypothetical protein
MHKENAALWRVKHLQTRLVGDHAWVPCDVMLGPNDIELFQDDYPGNQMKGSIGSAANAFLLDNVRADGSTNGRASINGEAYAVGSVGDSVVDGGNTETADTSMVDAEPSASSEKDADPEAPSQQETRKQGPPDKSNGPNANDNPQLPEDDGGRGGAKSASTNGPVSNGIGGSAVLKEEADGSVASQRNQSRSPAPSEDMSIHPLFLPPQTAHPDRDLGIPEQEAEDMRRLLQLYVQKQEEVCRGSKRLYEGLLRAERMRKTVFQWSKYEAHVGPNRDMSDGEDWYDKEEWGLEEDLKKGQDEEDEDTAQPAKKTRARR